jgi:photosystem II stability/assembly factor-like uncharacterized protein
MLSSRRAIFTALFLFCASALVIGQNFDLGTDGMQWRLIGPFRGGRTVAIAGIPDQPNVYYFAAVNGGVWKTADAGRTWKPIFDKEPTGSVGAMAIAPSNPKIIYVGSGEGLRRPDLAIGDGIYKSADGGETWQHLGLRDGQQIGSIIIDPQNPDRVFVAVLGHPYGPNAERGVFRSLDGGMTWQKVLYKDENTGAIDLAFDPTNPQTLYATMWASRRGPWTMGNPYDAEGSGLFRSTDGGTTWQPLTGGLPAWKDGLGRIGIGIAPSNPKRMYALVESTKLGGLYRSDDGGESWKLINREDRIYGRGSDFAMVRVDPRDENRVYVCNTSTYRSEDGGITFHAFKGAPGGDDYHTIWINPKNPDILFIGSDQGATLSLDFGQTWSSWYNQPTAQMFHVTADNRFPYWVYGGQQESGSAGVASRSDYGEISFRDWHPVGTEEYGYSAPDPLDPDIVYGGKGSRFDQRTGENQDVSPVVLRTGQYRFNRTAPLIFSPVDPHTLYLGSNVLFKTTTGGHDWQIISPDLTRPNPGVPPSLGVFEQSDPQHGDHRGVIYSIGPSFKDANVIWIGTDDGLIQVTRDGGKTWTNVTPPELTPWSKVAQIESGHSDDGTAYAAVNRFRLDDLHPYIYRTHDGGKSWQKITEGLPDDEPVNVVREDPQRKGLLFAGTEKSVYFSLDDGDHWQSLQLNLPHSSMRDLIVKDDDIVVATHGRSFWVLDDITPLRQLDPLMESAGAHLFKPQVTYRIRWNENTDTPLPPEEPAGKNPPDGAIIDYWLRAPATTPVVIEIVDSAGRPVRRYSSDDKPGPLNEKEINVPLYWLRPQAIPSAQAGMHRFVWDLHWPAPDALEHDYPIAAIVHNTPRTPQGPRAVPGDYTVKLAVNGQSYTQPLAIKMDPRLKASQAELEQQFQLESQIAEMMHNDFNAYEQVRSVRAQLMQLQNGTNRKISPKLSTALAGLDGKAARLEGTSGETFLRGPQGVSFARLNSALATIYGNIDSADAAPTTQAVDMFHQVANALTSQLATWNQITSTEIPAVNKQLQKARLPEISITAPPPPPPAREFE